MISIYDVLKASKGIHVDDTFAELWGRKLSNAYTVATYTGTLPATLTGTKTGYLESYKIYGNTEQNGTPTPENPIMPSECGERVDITGLNEPLCGIGTYTDSLELSTGTLTRRIKKLVLTGEETWYSFNLEKVVWQFYTNNIISGLASSSCMSNIAEYGVTGNTRVDYDYGAYLVSSGRGVAFQMRGSKDTFVDVDAWKVYLAQQYAAGTPVTVWYVLAEPEVSTIPVPSGLTGTIDGYLIQDGTPVPETPIYPTANGVKQADGTYSIFYGYKLPLTVNGAEYPIYLNEPLCGIGTYTDSLELSTGILTRKIKKLVLTGEEGWTRTVNKKCYYINSTKGCPTDYLKSNIITTICSHYVGLINTSTGSNKVNEGCVCFYTGSGYEMYIGESTITSAADFEAYLAQQYAAGTPVTVWYVLAEPEVSTIPVPSGLTSTIEGYLIQDGTPTPETPIYPTANGVKQADGTYIIPYGVEYPIYLGDAQLAKDEYVDSTTGKIYRRTKNLSPPEEEWVDGQIWGDGTIHPSTEIKTSPFIDVSICETCIMEVFSAETEWAAAGYREMAFYDENKQYLGWIGGGGRRTLTPDSTERLSEFPAGTVYVRISCSHSDQPFYPQLVSGYTPTHQFYPYLVPTDPPAPFPQIPTFAGTTTISWAGEGLAPSEVELTYRKRKGQ